MTTRIPRWKCFWLYLALCLFTNFLFCSFSLHHLLHTDPGYELDPPSWISIATNLLLSPFFPAPITIALSLAALGSAPLFYSAMLFFFAEPFFFIGFGRRWLLALLASIHILLVISAIIGFHHLRL